MKIEIKYNQYGSRTWAAKVIGWSAATPVLDHGVRRHTALEEATLAAKERALAADRIATLDERAKANLADYRANRASRVSINSNNGIVV
jgi:hypothetical protein